MQSDDSRPHTRRIGEDISSQQRSCGPMEHVGQSKVTPSVQRFTDGLVNRAILWAIPYTVRPNHFTVARFLLIPAILALLYFDLRWWALGGFIIAACTDFIDGTMARVRRQITSFGTYADPVADKLLVGAVLAWIGYDYLVVQIILAFIVLELALMAVGVSLKLRNGQMRSSNAFGKTKMVFQSIALVLFLLSAILKLDTWVTISIALLWAALALAFLSGTKQIYDLFNKNRHRLDSRF